MNEGARQAAYQPWLTKLNVDVAKLTMLHGSNEGVDKRKAELAHMFGESTAQRFHERVLAETTRQRKSSSILIPSAAGTFVATHAKATTMYGA